MNLMIFLAVASLILSGAALAVLMNSRKKVSIALSNATALAEAFGTKPKDYSPKNDANAPLLSIEILNPMELAAEKSWIAGTISSISPGFIRKKVYEETRGILEEKLVEFGVQADVQVVRND